MGNITNPESTMTRGSVVKGGLDKRKRYNWNPIGVKGEFCMISKHELHIDHGYQRDRLNNERINSMAAKWDWVYCGALSVAERFGKWFVIDGQHRKLAADKRSDIDELPCMVFTLDSQQLEAGAFVGLNSQKTAVSGIDRFKAMIVAGDETAIGLKRLLDDSGYQLSNKPMASSVTCIQTLWKMYRRDAALLEKLWKLMVLMTPKQPVVDCLVRGLCEAERRANLQQISITEDPICQALVNIGGSVLAAEIRREAGIAGVGGERVEGAAVVKWINRQKLGAKYRIAV